MRTDAAFTNLEFDSGFVYCLLPLACVVGVALETQHRDGRVLLADPVVSLHLGEACVAHNKGLWILKSLGLSPLVLCWVMYALCMGHGSLDFMSALYPYVLSSRCAVHV